MPNWDRFPSSSSYEHLAKGVRKPCTLRAQGHVAKQHRMAFQNVNLYTRTHAVQVQACWKCVLQKKPQLHKGKSAKPAAQLIPNTIISPRQHQDPAELICSSSTELTAAGGLLPQPAGISSNWMMLQLASENAGSQQPQTVNQQGLDPASGSGKEPGDDKKDEDDSPAVRAALAMLAFYRGILSPLMQPSCRYLPTCSNYSIESYKKFGVWKGSVLTAWRLLRCSPLGSSGYDPPMWPPPGLGLLYGEGTWEYSPHVTVVVGAVLLGYIARELSLELANIFF